MRIGTLTESGEDTVPSMKCHQCGKVKRCRLHVEPSPLGEPHKIITYICLPCERELNLAGEDS